MLLAIDIGNTNITLGVFDDRELLGKFRMTTMMSRTSDEYGITLRELLRNQNMNPDEIDAVIVASVVPDIMHSFSSAIIKYFGHKPVIVSAWYPSSDRESKTDGAGSNCGCGCSL